MTMIQQRQQRQKQHHFILTSSFLSFLILQFISFTNGFATTTTNRLRGAKFTFLNHDLHKQNNRPSHSSSSPSSTITTLSMIFDSSSNNSNNNDDYYSSFLNTPQSSTTQPQCTHLIGIPLSQTHDLLSTLESIQRSILQECPFLIKAAIVPIVTRMPLLCVDGRDESGTMVDRGYVTDKLSVIVRDVVDEFIFVQGEMNDQKVKDEEEEEEENMGGVNSQGIKPLLMPFRGLELDGEDNSVLHAIGEEDCDGTKLLRSVVTEIQKRIEEQHGWETFYPPEDPQEKVLPKNVDQEEEFMDVQESREEENGEMWRPRVPFMRLPPNFEESLPIPENDSDNDGDDPMAAFRSYQDEDGQTKYIRTPEEGGNGISPLFWYPWINDDLTTAPEGTRLRSIAIYGRTGPSAGIAENSFYIPHKSIDLPEGNKVLMKSELEEERRDEEKYKGMGLDDEDMMTAGGEFMKARDDNDGDVLVGDEQTEIDREKLERIFAQKDVGELQDLLSNLKEEKELGDDLLSSLKEEKDIMSESMKLQDEIKSNVADLPPGEIIDAATSEPKPTEGKISESQKNEALQQQSEIEQLKEESYMRKDLPPPEENPILLKFRQNRENNIQTMAADTPTPESSKPQHPFPHNDYFVGVWRLVSSPLSGGNEFLEDGSESSDCDNLILRVDGTIAGGPVLDYENQHKAAGGTWNMFRAVWTGDGDNDEEVKKEQVRLRITLIVPPERNKLVVMEGEVTRGMMMMMGGSDEDSNDGDTSTLFASSTFGIPEVENVRKASIQKNKEDLLHCGGEVWVEDYFETEKEREEAGSARRRKKLGMFSLMKLKAPNRDTLRYTVPIPKGFGGGGSDDGDSGEGKDENN